MIIFAKLQIFVFFFHSGFVTIIRYDKAVNYSEEGRRKEERIRNCFKIIITF